MNEQLKDIFSEADEKLTAGMRTKVGRDDFSLRECYASSRDDRDGYTYGGVFFDKSCLGSTDFKFYVFGEIDGSDVGASVVVDGRRLFATDENLFDIQQRFDDKYEAVALRGMVRPVVIEDERDAEAFVARLKRMMRQRDGER